MTIQTLVDLYQKNRDTYISPSYNEAQLRSDFLDPLFELLGWDIKNSLGRPTNEREVILEEPLRSGMSENLKKPDYTFRLFSERKFFLEAKKPSVTIEQNDPAARQVRRYGFTAKLKISIVSNFEYLLIYDCSEVVNETDGFSKGLIDKIHFSEYTERFEDLKKYFGKSAVYSGDFDREWEHIEERIKLFGIDDYFLNQINEWRLLLGAEIYRISPSLKEDQLNNYVQGYLNSIIFLRVCEDRNLEQYQDLLQMATNEDFDALVRKFNDADRKYNSGLFNQYVSEGLIKNAESTFWEIIKKLYYPESPYSFSVFSSDILGAIYEIFLSEKLVIRANKIELEKKPEHVDRDVITTPTFIIQNILNETLLPYCQEKSDQELLNIKIADISCGSGSFLLQTFQFLNDFLIDYYLGNSPDTLVQTSVNTFKLPFAIKRDILTQCIFGIDKDFNAIQAARFGLSLKLLEGETNATLPTHTSILPDLSGNISYGNSLISPAEADELSTKQQVSINPLNLDRAPFDIVIGNPPYMKSEDMKTFTPIEHAIYPDIYQSAFRQYDKYYLFIERGLQVLKKGGVLGYIVPSKFTKIGSGGNLRSLITSGRYLSKIVSFGANQIFENRTTYTCLLFLKKDNQDEVSFLDVKNIEKWVTRQPQANASETFLSDYFSGENWILLNKNLKQVYEKILDQSAPLLEIVGDKNIFNGIQTSANEVFVIRPNREDDRYIFFEKDEHEFKIEKELTRPYFETSNGKDNLYTYRDFAPNASVIYPYKKVGDTVSFIPADELEARYPLLFRYLSLHRERLSKRDVKPEPTSDQEWYRYGRHQSLDKLDISPKLIVGVLSMGDKYSVDKNGTFISSGGTAGYCAISLPEDSQYSIYYLQAILNSKYAEWICTLIGDIFRGGYFAHGTAVLERLPVRTINFSDTSDIALHNEIRDLQLELIDIQGEIDRNASDEPIRIRHERAFHSKKEKLDQKLKLLYGLEQLDDQIPLLKDLYEAD